MQVVDEARHAEAFTRRAEAGGLGLGTTAATGQLSLQTLLEEADFTTAYRKLRPDLGSLWWRWARGIAVDWI